MTGERWTRDSLFEKNVVDLFKNGAIDERDMPNHVFKKYPNLWPGVKLTNFKKNLKRIRDENVQADTNKPPENAKTDGVQGEMAGSKHKGKYIEKFCNNNCLFM